MILNTKPQNQLLSWGNNSFCVFMKEACSAVSCWQATYMQALWFFSQSLPLSSSNFLLQPGMITFCPMWVYKHIVNRWNKSGCLKASNCVSRRAFVGSNFEHHFVLTTSRVFLPQFSKWCIKIKGFPGCIGQCMLFYKKTN